MTDPRNQKEALFYWYCPQCKHKTVPEEEDPCNECLTYPSNENSHKPKNYICADPANEKLHP